MLNCRPIHGAIVLAIALLMPASGNCGPVFDRVMKSGEVRLGIPYNLTPQGFLNSSGEWVGFEVDFAAELAKHLDLKLHRVKVTEQTWGPMLGRGQIDAALCRIRHTRSLESEFDFSVPYFFDVKQILVRKGAFQNVQGLKGHKIAALQGSSSEKVAMNLLREAGDEAAEKNVVSYPDRPACFLAVGQNEVSGWIDSGMILLEYASRSPGGFALLDAAGVVEPVAAAVPQNDSAWRDMINFAIQDMASDGTLSRIYDKWFGPSTEYPFPSRRIIEIWPE
ncbi:MAG: transporter substrate-binding domain-containing protein [Desulfomonilaceae bacterium]|nr:transporter substrate-binding domain-containing protein [Desulfomonilaceae bacterium]